MVVAIAMSDGQQSENAEHILHAAVKLFAQKGYEATSTREIMEAAGITKPMLYYYFGSKEGLCRAAIRRFADYFLTCLQKEIDEPRPPRDTLVEVTWLHFRLLLEKPEVNRFFLMIYFGPDRASFIADIEAVAERMHALLMQIVDRMDKAGMLRPDCKQDFFMALHGLIHIWSAEAMEHGAPLDHALAERIVDGLLCGYGNK
jgi:AcrR family transcriptional regulator